MITQILQVLPYFYPAFAFGGPVPVVYNLSRELARRGHEVSVYTTNALDRKRSLKLEEDLRCMDGFYVRYFKNIVRPYSFFFSPDIIRIAKREIPKFDSIHLHGYRTFQNIVIAHYAKKHGVPYVLQAHGTLPRIRVKQRLKWIYDVFFGYRLLRDASKVIALSQVEAEQYRDMGVPGDKIAIIPNGIDLSEYADLPPKGTFKKKFGIDDNEKIVLYLGRIHKLKGIDFLIKAYSCLVKNGVKDSKLVIAGPDDGYLSKARELACSSGISSSVLFLGFVTERDKVSAYVDSAVVVYPGQYEPFGLVSLEAAVFGKPVLIASGTPMSRIIKKGNFGFSINYGDITSLAESLKMLLKNEDLAHAMGKRWRRYVKNNFDWKTTVSKIEAVYEDALT